MSDEKLTQDIYHAHHTKHGDLLPDSIEAQSFRERIEALLDYLPGRIFDLEADNTKRGEYLAAKAIEIRDLKAANAKLVDNQQLFGRIDIVEEGLQISGFVVCGDQDVNGWTGFTESANAVDAGIKARRAEVEKQRKRADDNWTGLETMRETYNAQTLEMKTVNDRLTEERNEAVSNLETQLDAMDKPWYDVKKAEDEVELLTGLLHKVVEETGEGIDGFPTAPEADILTAHPGNTKWISLDTYEGLKAEVERLRGALEQIQNNTRADRPWKGQDIAEEVNWCATAALAAKEPK